MTSSTKPEVHNLLHCRQRRTESRPQVTCAENSVKFGRVIFGRPLQVTVLPMQGTVVLSVTLVYCGQTVGCIRMPLGMEVGLGPGHSELDGDPAPPRKGAQQPSLSGPCLLWPIGRPSQQLLSSC